MNNQNKYLVIGGSTKCGTTSVFNYFEFHPGICPCIMKESRYFLESEYKLVAKQRSNNIYNSFSDLFRNCNPGSVLFEATPDYLYSSKAAEKIKAEIPGCKIIFILREPVSRLESWYRFASLNGLINRETTFSDYIFSQNKNNTNPPQHMRSLEQGRYAEYLEYYFKLFPKEQIHICFYEDLISDPKSFCNAICRFAGINSEYFNNYSFKIFNKSVAVKNVGVHKLFRKFKRTVRPATRLLPLSLRKRLKLAGYSLEKSYTSINAAENETSVELTTDLKSFLSDYYSKSNEHLRNLTESKIPWQNGKEA